MKKSADEIRAGMAAVSDKRAQPTKAEVQLAREALAELFDGIDRAMDLTKDGLAKLRVVVDGIFAESEAVAPERRP